MTYEPTTVNDRQVTVLGLGKMGAALASALLDAGYRVVVWNRTAAKAHDLTGRGAIPAASVRDAVLGSPLVIACLLDYENVREVLAPHADALTGRTLVNVTTGTPDQAGGFAEWAVAQGVRYLDGAMMAVPQTVATPDAFFLYSGSKEAFDAYRPVLDHLATSHFLGTDPSAAELWDLALLGSGYAALTGFLHGVALLGTGGVAPSRFLPLATEWLRGVLAFMPELAGEIEAGDYTGGVSPVGMNRAAVDNLVRASTRQGVDADVHTPLLRLLDRRIADGHAADSFSSIVEVLRKPRS